jgi:transposase
MRLPFQKPKLSPWSAAAADATFEGGSLMRKMREYVVRNKRVFIGLEDAKRTWKLCVRSGGIVVQELSLPAEYENLRTYLRTGYPGCEIHLIYEAGFGGFWLYDRLTAEGIDCIVTPPNKVTQEKVNKVKTDRIDARRLARNLETGDITRCHVPDPERRADRQISRTLNQTQRMIVATKNRIRRFLDFHGLNGGLPAGAWKDRQYQQLRELSLPRPLQMSLTVFLRSLTELQAIREELTAELKELCTKERYREAVALKQSCPGVGWLSAIRFTLEWGELTRFPDGKRLASFTGLTSREYSTGETIHRGRITGQGTGEVRGWLIQCAWRAIRSDPVLLDKFHRVWKNSGSKKKAIVAVARKLAVRMRAVELSRTPYSLGVIA